MKELTQNQTSEPIVFLMIDSTLHIAGKTGLTPTVTLSKNGGAFASPAGAVTEMAHGWYKIAGNATDTNTLGPLVVHAESAGADPVDDCYQVVAVNPRLASYGLALAKTTNLTGLNDIASTDVVSAGPIGTNGGAVLMVNGLAANTVTASALAADAVTEIQSGLATTANVSAVETDTQDIQSRLPAALAGGFMKSDVLAINGSTIAATITAAINGSLKTGTVDDATFAPTSTVFETDIATDSDEFTKQTLLWTGGLNAGMFVRVLSYAFVNSKVKLTLSEALPNVPVDGDTFAVTSRIE